MKYMYVSISMYTCLCQAWYKQFPMIQIMKFVYVLFIYFLNKIILIIESFYVFKILKYILFILSDPVCLSLVAGCFISDVQCLRQK